MLIAIMITAVTSGWLGWDYRGDHEQAKQVTAMKEMQEDHEKNVLVEIAAALVTERKLQSARVESRLNTEKILAYAKTDKTANDICFNDNDIRMWNESNKATTETSATKLPAKVSGIFQRFKRWNKDGYQITTRQRLGAIYRMQNQTQRLS